MKSTVFLGSTTRELAKYRDAVYELLCALENTACYRNEDTGQTEPGLRHQDVQEMLNSCNLAIIVIGHFYGEFLNGANISVTEAEFDYAQEVGIDRLVFIASEDLLIPALFREDDTKWKLQRKFRTKAKGCKHQTFNSVESLVFKVAREFHQWLERNLELQIADFNNLLNSNILQYENISQLNEDITSTIIPPFIVNSLVFPKKITLVEIFTRLSDSTKNQGNRSAKVNPQDMTPFIPVIVEATKFLLSEASKWISDLRKKANTPSSLQLFEVKLPISENQLLNVQSDPTTLIQLVNESTTATDVYAIKSLLNKIENNRQVLAQLEEQETLASGEELAKTKVNIQKKAQAILESIEQLEALLKHIYRDAK